MTPPTIAGSTVQVTNVKDNSDGSATVASVASVVFYVGSIGYNQQNGKFTTVSATNKGNGLWTANTADLPPAADLTTLHAVAVDGSGNYTDCAVNAPACGQTDVFAVGNNGQLQAAWVSPGYPWGGPAGIGSASVFPPGARVVASPQYGVNNQIDVFAVGNNGQLQVVWMYPGFNWGGPAGIGPAGVFPPGAAVAASPHYGVNNRTDVFAVGNNGQLQVAWWSPGNGWNGPVGIGSAGVLPPGAGVVASPQYGVNNQIDVFAVGNNGQLQAVWMYPGFNWGGPAGIGPASVFPGPPSLVTPPGAGVVASPHWREPPEILRLQSGEPFPYR
jgi:hypothetical protein